MTLIGAPEAVGLLVLLLEAAAPVLEVAAVVPALPVAPFELLPQAARATTLTRMIAPELHFDRNICSPPLFSLDQRPTLRLLHLIGF